MKKISMILVVLMAFVVFQGVAQADSVSGKVASIDAAANSISVTVINAETKAEESVNVSIKPETTFSGVVALAEVKEGQEVSIEASKDATGRYSATSVSIKKAAEEAPKAAEPAAAQ